MNNDNHKTLQEFAMGEIIKELRAERDALKAELEALYQQEPIMENTPEGWLLNKTYVVGTKLYASPVPAQHPEAADVLIERLWQNSNHGTRREDIEAAFKAGAGTSREDCNCIRWKSKTVAFRAYVDQKTYDGFAPEVQKWYEPILTEQPLEEAFKAGAANAQQSAHLVDEIEDLNKCLISLRASRDSTGHHPARQALNMACDRLGVAISKLHEASKRI